MQLNKQLFLGIACLAVAFATPQNGTFPSPVSPSPSFPPVLIFPFKEEGKSEKRRQYISPMVGVAQVPRNIPMAG